MDDHLHELTLSGLAYGGDALGRIPQPRQPDRVVFVPFAIPGERVRVRIVQERRGFARAELLEVLEPSPDRIVPRCGHFGACGGCHYQHMPYDMQLKAKVGILRDQFRRIGHMDDPPVQDAVPSPDPWNYRNHVQFHLTADGRLGYIGAGHVGAGLLDSQTSDQIAHRPVRAPGLSVLPISECHLPEPGINNLWPQLEFGPDTGIQRVSIRQGTGDDELMLILESDSADLPELEMDASMSTVHLFKDHSVVMAGAGHLTMQVLGRNFRVSAPSFFQVNTRMAAKMVEHILANLASPKPGLSDQHSTILDVYCGAGLFSAFLAPRCEHLIGIESSPSACEDFAANLDEFDNVELYEDTAENVLSAVDVQPDLVLVDPPRSGLHPDALSAILRLHPATLIYVSCDPSTLARDARRLLDGGYRLTSCTPFDLFPQTYHIESISWFQR